MFKHENDSIFIGGVKIPLDVFVRLEPGYRFPKDLVVMFYDGDRRHFRTKHRSWSVPGKWSEGDRYISRLSEFVSLVVEDSDENIMAYQRVSDIKRASVKAKYPVEDTKNVELHKRDDLDKGGTEGVRSKGKRVSRSRGKHSGGAIGGSSE